MTTLSPAILAIGPTPNFTDLEFGDPEIEDCRTGLGPSECRDLPSDDEIKEWAIAAMAKHRLLKGKDELRGRTLILPQYDKGGNLTGERKYLRRSKLYSLVPVGCEAVRAATEATVAKIAELGPGVVWFLGAPVHVMREDGVPRGLVRPDQQPRVVLVSYYGHEAQGKDHE